MDTGIWRENVHFAVEFARAGDDLGESNCIAILDELDRAGPFWDLVRSKSQTEHSSIWSNKAAAF